MFVAQAEGFGLDPGAMLGMAAPGTMWARYVFGSLVLLYAIWTDLRYRRVKNQVWMVVLAVGAALAAWDWLRGAPDWRWFAFVPVVMGVAYVLWRLRLLFGGADAKCVMAFALLVPYPPALVSGGGETFPHLAAVLPTAVTMLTNAVLLTLLVPVVFFFMNLARGHLHPLAMFLGTRMRLERVLREPVWVMDWVRLAPGVEGGAEGPALAELSDDPDLDALPPVDPATLEGATRRLVYMPTRAGDYALNLARLQAMGMEEVWVSPKVPFMVPLFFGFVAAFLAGDLVWSGLLWLMDGL